MDIKEKASIIGSSPPEDLHILLSNYRVLLQQTQTVTDRAGLIALKNATKHKLREIKRNGTAN
jgi:hypothetical protein